MSKEETKPLQYQPGKDPLWEFRREQALLAAGQLKGVCEVTQNLGLKRVVSAGERSIRSLVEMIEFSRHS